MIKSFVTKNNQTTETYIYRYYNELETKTTFLVDDPSKVIKIDEIFKRIRKRQGYFCDENLIGNIVYDCFRKYVLEKIRDDDVKPQKGCIVLCEYQKNKSKGPNKDDELALQRILSYFNRKQFDYFINRYYLFQEVHYNRRMERRIAKLMNGRGAAWPIRWKKTKVLPPGAANYVGYLDSMPEWFLNQIGAGKKKIVPHPEAGTLSVQQRNFQILRGYFVLYPVILLVLTVVAYLLSVYINNALK